MSDAGPAIAAAEARLRELLLAGHDTSAVRSEIAALRAERDRAMAAATRAEAEARAEAERARVERVRAAAARYAEEAQRRLADRLAALTPQEARQ